MQCPGPLPTGGQGAPSQHAAVCGGGEGLLSPLRALGDFRSPLLAPTRGLSAWTADSTREGRLRGEAEHGDRSQSVLPIPSRTFFPNTQPPT